jgi:hypothetical protein
MRRKTHDTMPRLGGIADLTFAFLFAMIVYALPRFMLVLRRAV